MPVLHGIEVNVFHVSLQIEIIAYRVFPESPLPQASFAFRCFRAPQRCHAGKRRFNEAPSNRVVRIALGQRPDAMHVIGQYNYGRQRERVPEATRAHHRTKSDDLVRERGGMTVEQRYREEVRGAGDPITAVTNHRRRVPRRQAFDIRH